MKGSQRSFNCSDSEENELFEDSDIHHINQASNPQELYTPIRDNYELSQNIHLQSENQFFQPKRSKLFVIIASLLMMVLVLSSTYYFKDIISFIIIKFQILQIQQHTKDSKFTWDVNSYKILAFEHTHLPNFDQHLKNICPNIQQTFHVNFNTSFQQQNLSINIRNQIDLCGTPILTVKDLNELIEKWNEKFPEMVIMDQNIQAIHKKQNLLVLLRLFFSGGTYINISIPYSKVQSRCQKSVLTGFDIIFGDFQQKNQHNVYVPNINSFIKVRFPFSPLIKKMISKIIKNQDFLEECKTRQCLVMKCF